MKLTTVQKVGIGILVAGILGTIIYFATRETTEEAVSGMQSGGAPKGDKGSAAEAVKGRG